MLVTGASGSGKSTLLFCINGIIPHVLEGRVQGEITVGGMRPADVPLGEAARVIGTVFQNPDNQIFMLRVGDDVAFGCENIGLTPETTRERVDAALRALDLLPLKDRETSKLSGGQKQRLAIAGAYAMQPQVLLFDEPMTDLDQKGRVEFGIILRRLKEGGHTILLTDHDGEAFEVQPDKVLTLDGNVPPGDDGLASLETAGRIYQAGGTAGDAIILSDVDYRFADSGFSLRGITLTVKRGEFVAVVGTNGSGKTTLLRVMLGLLRPTRGSLSVLSMPDPSLDALAGKVGYLFQNPDKQLFASTVEGELSLGALRRMPQQSAEHLLRHLGLERYRRVHPHCLSRGERKKVAFLSVLMQRSDIILLDEPTTGLDERNWRKLMDLAEGFCGQGGTVIFSSHNMKAVARYAGRVITLDGGRIAADEG